MEFRALTGLSVLLLSACAPAPEQFTPASFVEKLRVLGVRAEPPDVAPGGRTTLDALVVDAQPNRTHSYVWVICDPDPTGVLGSPCATQQAARDPGELLGGGVPGIHVHPFTRTATWEAPANAFDGLPPGSVARRRGLEATVLLIVFEGEDLEALRRGEVEAQFALKRVRVVDAGTTPNRNPRIADVTLDGVPLPADAAPEVPRATPFSLAAAHDPALEEPFARVLSDGTEEARTEPSVFSWFTTGGRFEQLGGLTSNTIGPAPVTLQPPDAGARVDLFVLLRDGRGGLDWTARTVRLAP